EARTANGTIEWRFGITSRPPESSHAQNPDNCARVFPSPPFAASGVPVPWVAASYEQTMTRAARIQCSVAPPPPRNRAVPCPRSIPLLLCPRQAPPLVSPPVQVPL